MRYVRNGATAVLVIVLLALLPTASVRAAIRVTATADLVRVEAHDASVEDVLATLHEQFGLQYRSAAPLDRRISGTYEGSLQRVVTRLLEGYDFIVKRQAGALSVVITGASKFHQFQIVPPPRERPY